MKLMLKLLAVVLRFAVAALAFGTARAELRLEISDIEWTGRSGRGYSVFSAEEQMQIVRFRVRATEATPFFVAFSGRVDGSGKRKATGPAHEMEYFVCDSVVRRTALKDLSFGHSAEVIRGSFSGRETEKELSCVIVLPAGQALPPGRYTDALRVNLYKGTPEKHELSDSKSLAISIPVEATTELSLGPAGAGFDAKSTFRALNFGQVVRGKALDVDLRVRSNAGYSITIESENGGHMKNVDMQEGSILPYELRVGGKSIAIKAPHISKVKQKRQGDTNGDRHPLQFSIGDTAGATAGTYRDNITITVTSD
jgi:spore coat protein U-like protein